MRLKTQSAPIGWISRQHATNESGADAGIPALTATEDTSHRRFTVTVTGDAARRVARASGPLFGAAEDLVETIVDHLVRHGISDIMLDLGAVTDIDAAAMQLLVDYRADLRASGVALTFDMPVS